MFRILESQAPAKQTATDTIDVLSSRLQSATLLEDRRAAIQGLRSFAKLYPASVASGGLRSLIGCLHNDREDVDTIKVVLETLLMLFTPEETSPEASDEIALWLADEFTQRQDNITTLLDLLEARDFYSRLYSLQLMSHICNARPERTQECIFTAPLGISRLVNVLTDTREPVRNEALVLLIALTPASEELQKLVAFENAFEIIFSLIEAEGALTLGTEVVEDCLTLLAHLLKFNVSNQSFFRETGCVKKLTKLLHECQLELAQGEDTPAQWTLVHRDKNVWGLLAIIQLFLIRGGVGTPMNQTAFWQNGVTEQVLSIAFGQKFGVNVTSKALATCADLIRGNSPLQESFGDIEVLWGSQTPRDQSANGHVDEPERINVIEAFLKLSLQPSPNSMLDARLAACECMKAFFAHHPGIRMHVLKRAIEGHVSGQDRIPNILSVLLIAPDARGNADPYQVWMASVLLFHLIFDDAEAKAIAMQVTEGDAESGEEVVTSVQSVVGNLITGLQRGDDERITVGYLMLLCGWLFEDPDVVNDLLVEGSSIQTLLQEIKHQRAPSKLIPGLCTVLLGIIYEFSTKDSPIPRVTLHKLLIEQLGREQYIDKITKLRECPLVRDFEVLPQTAAGQIDGLPEVFFDRSFVEFLKDNFSRLIRAIDREPGFEVSVVANGVEKGVSRDLVDSLRAELEDRGQTIQKLESDLVTIQRKLDQEHLDHRKTKESGSFELSKAQQALQSVQTSHGQELFKLEEQHKQSKNELLKQHGEQLRAIDNQLKQASAEYERKGTKMQEHHKQEVASMQKTIRGLESELSKAREKHAGEAAALQRTVQDLESAISQSKKSNAGQVADLQQKLHSLESTLASSKSQHESEITGFKTTIRSLESDLAAVKKQHQTEIADSKQSLAAAKSDLESAQEKSTAEIEKLKEDFSSKMSALEASAADAERKAKEAESQASEKSTKDIQAANEGFSSKISALETRAAEAERKAKEAESQAQSAAAALKEIKAQLEKAQAEANEKEEARQATQTELDDLLIVFGDLEAKRTEDKKRLKDLGQEVSEAEDDDEDEEEGDEDEE
ncbi:vesicle-mediated ER to Golgi transport protein [Penicillium ochrochloron]